MKINLAMYIFFKQRGVGLIELMISMLIGLFIMAGVLQLFSTSSQNAVANAGVSRIQENIRYTFSRLADDIGQTGNLGCVSLSSNKINNKQFMNNMLDLTAVADSGDAYDFSTIINGVDSATATTKPADQIAVGTDTYRIRYVDHGFRIPLITRSAHTESVKIDFNHVDFPRLEQYQVVAVTDCDKGAIFMITNVPNTATGEIKHEAGVTAPEDKINEGLKNASVDKQGIFTSSVGTSTITSPAYLYGGNTGAYQYFIGTSAKANAAGEACDRVNEPQHCALFRRKNADNQEIAEGVHDMQVTYGWTDTAGTLRFATANNVTDWTVIDRVNIELSFNSIDNAVFSANNPTALITKTVSKTFNLSNQL